jgi:polysaccharide pyruvyl transferase WcaK-like protein
MAPRDAVAFWGNFGTRNLGNEVTLSAAVQAVRRRRPGARLQLVCTAPEDAGPRHGLPASSLRSWSGVPSPPVGLPRRLLRRLGREWHEWAEALRRTGELDTLVMTGTGMLTDVGEGPLGLPADLFRWALAARLRGCRVVFLSVGVEPLRHPLTRGLVRAALAAASYRSYRDGQSRDRLVAAGIPVSADPLAPDLAFSLPPLAETVPSAYRRRTIGVGLYDYRCRGAAGEDDARAYAGYLDRMAELVERLVESGDRVRVLIGDNTYDEPVLADFRARLAGRGRLRPGDVEDTPAEGFEALLGQLAQVDLVVASRFHNVLLALLLGRPVVSLSYNEKNEALMEAAGLAGNSRPLEAIEVDWILERLEALHLRRDELRASLRDAAGRWRTELETQYDRVFGPVPPPR